MARGPYPLGSDPTYIDKYFSGSSLSQYDSLMTIGKSLPPSTSFSQRLLRSPLEISVGGLSEEQITEYADKHVSLWLQWISEAPAVVHPSRSIKYLTIFQRKPAVEER